MPTNIRLTTMPGTIEKCSLGDVLLLDILGPSLGQETITIHKTGEVTGAVKAFGERIRAEHPDASFKIIIAVLKGQRKPSGYDAAARTNGFGDRAFMAVEADRAQPPTGALAAGDAALAGAAP